MSPIFLAKKLAKIKNKITANNVRENLAMGMRVIEQLEKSIRIQKLEMAVKGLGIKRSF